MYDICKKEMKLGLLPINPCPTRSSVTGLVRVAPGARDLGAGLEKTYFLMPINVYFHGLNT